jgi:hypothetical protein
MQRQFGTSEEAVRSERDQNQLISGSNQEQKWSPHLQHRSHSENNLVEPYEQAVFRRKQGTSNDNSDNNTHQNDRESRLQRAYDSLDHIDRQISGLRNSNVADYMNVSDQQLSHLNQQVQHHHQQQQFRGTVIFKSQQQQQQLNQSHSQSQQLQPQQPAHYVQHAYPPQHQMRSLPPSPPSSMQQYPSSQPLNRTVSDGYPPARVPPYHVSPPFHQHTVPNVFSSQTQYYQQHHPQHQILSQHTFPGAGVKSGAAQQHQTTQSHPQGLSFVYMVSHILHVVCELM